MNTLVNPTPSARVAQPNATPALKARLEEKRFDWTQVLFMLVVRTVLFAFFQALIAFVLMLQGADQPWNAAIGYWPLTTTFANIVCIALLDRLTRHEGIRLLGLIPLDSSRLALDLLTAVGVLIISAPLVVLPSYALGSWLFGDPNAPSALMFQALPIWVAALCLVFFPLTVALSELPTYFAYVMPRLAVLTGRPWFAWLLAACWLGLQHATMPLVLDWRFMLWRALMFLPFALFIGACVFWRPRLLPYLMVGHGLLDLVTIWMIFSLSLR